MSPLHLLFGFRGRINRKSFTIAFLSVVALLALARQAAWWILPWLGSVFGPRGVNAGFIFNGMLTAIWFFGTWMVLALAAKRLHDRGQSGIWATLAVLPLVALVMLNDEILLLSTKLVLPATAHMAGLVFSTALGVWVLIQGLLLPSRDR